MTAILLIGFVLAFLDGFIRSGTNGDMGLKDLLEGLFEYLKRNKRIEHGDNGETIEEKGNDKSGEIWGSLGIFLLVLASLLVIGIIIGVIFLIGNKSSSQ